METSALEERAAEESFRESPLRIRTPQGAKRAVDETAVVILQVEGGRVGAPHSLPL